jgi:rhamnosyltransferase
MHKVVTKMVTVLMSTYNGELYLSEQLDSILNQTHDKVNLLVRDDGSTDNTIKILKIYANNNRKIKWYQGNNLGCGKSFFQLVLDAPTSDYYAFSDQDDFWENDKLQSAIDVISQYPHDVPILYCTKANPVDENLQPYEYRKIPMDVSPSFGNALTMNIAPGCTFVFNKKLLMEFRKMNINDIDIHDWSLYRVVTAIGGIVYYDKTSYIKYRQHSNNVIGYQSTIIQHWIRRIKRFKNKEYRTIRHQMAKDIKKVYYDKMPEENKVMLDTFVNYKNSFKEKIKLLKMKEFRMGKKTDNIILKILIVVGLI